MAKKMTREIRCAIYTRKSNEDGLEQEFNSIDSQRAECEKFFATQKQEGWLLLEKKYDDGGFSGGNLDRPGLRELLHDIELGKVNYVIVFKLNRLTRSLVDFIRVISDRFNRNRVRFRSVTEPYLNEDSTDNEFLLHLNLGIAQRERKAVGDHLKIKIAGSKERGLWMGGNPPLGYDVEEKKLIINREEEKVIKHIFARFIELKSMTVLVRELNRQGYRTKRFQTKSGKTYGGDVFKKATMRRIITNPIYVGRVRHHDKQYKGQHEAIIVEEKWDEVQALIENRSNRIAKYEGALLKSVIRCQSCNVSMIPTHTKKKNKRYRYYVCNNHFRGKHCPSINRTVAAGEVERHVIKQIRYMFKCSAEKMKGADNLRKLDEIWENLFPVKQQEIIKKLIKTVWIREDGIEVCLESKGLEEVRNGYAA